jgi:hypothetical protein
MLSQLEFDITVSRHNEIARTPTPPCWQAGKSKSSRSAIAMHTDMKIETLCAISLAFIATPTRLCKDLLAWKTQSPVKAWAPPVGMDEVEGVSRSVIAARAIGSESRPAQPLV